MRIARKRKPGKQQYYHYEPPTGGNEREAPTVRRRAAPEQLVAPVEHTCNNHHCYHTIPGSYGGSRSDTYDDTRCCNCGQSEPNPYDNERR